MSVHATSDLAVLGGDPVRTAPFPDAPPVGREEADGRPARAGVRRAQPLPRRLGPRLPGRPRGAGAGAGLGGALRRAARGQRELGDVGALRRDPGGRLRARATRSSSRRTPWRPRPPARSSAAPCRSSPTSTRRPCASTPTRIRARVTPRTKAIVVVAPARLPGRHGRDHGASPREHGLVVIEDAAQAPGGDARRAPIGTIGDIGVFSLNYHKTIHSGEGGVAVTRDARLAERLRLVRNHGEVVTGREGGPRPAGHPRLQLPHDRGRGGHRARAARQARRADRAADRARPPARRAPRRPAGPDGAARARRAAATSTTSTACATTRPSPACRASAWSRRCARRASRSRRAT